RRSAPGCSKRRREFLCGRKGLGASAESSDAASGRDRARRGRAPRMAKLASAALAAGLLMATPLSAWAQAQGEDPDFGRDRTTARRGPLVADDKDLFDLTGKVALITGGSRGLGLQMVRAFARNGADVIVASRKLDACEAAAAEVRALGRRAMAYSVHAARWD